MTLQEFEADFKASVDRFFADWRANHLRDADQYPDEMEPGDWDEQMMVHLFGLVP